MILVQLYQIGFADLSLSYHIGAALLIRFCDCHLDFESEPFAVEK
jgi:hypothetical protein